MPDSAKVIQNASGRYHSAGTGTPPVSISVETSSEGDQTPGSGSQGPHVVLNGSLYLHPQVCAMYAPGALNEAATTAPAANAKSKDIS